MATYGITAVRLGGQDRVEAAMIGLINTRENIWANEPVERPVLEIVNLIHHGDTVLTIFPVDGLRVVGPTVRIVLYQQGREGIEAVDPAPGRSLADMPRL